MGCTTSSPVLDEKDPYYQSKAANDAIDQLLQKSASQKHQLKLLLLGTGESGKSTVLKQMRLLHQNGFTPQERLQYAQVIWTDAIQSIKILIIQARTFGIKLDCDQPDSPLCEFKRKVLQYNALIDIDMEVTYGSNFLKDYVVRYSRKSELRRRESSTGKIASLPWEEQEKAQQVFDESDELQQQQQQQAATVEDIMRTLDSENNDDGAVIVPGTSSILKTTSSSSIPGMMDGGLSATTRLTKLDVAQAAKELWMHDSGIQRCFARANEFQLEANAPYYFNNIMKFCQPNYMCSDEDILKGRIKTTGISETTFAIGGTKFKVLDAGGQRSERSKWIHCFEGITAVLFVMAISEYDQNLFEDNSVNRMQEAMHLFYQLCNSRWFYSTPFILFINKMDIFEKKIQTSPIKKYFPNYQGGANLEEATRYFENCFKSLNKTSKQLYIHRTCATDTQSMKFILTAVTDMIINQSLARSGMI